MNNFQFQACLDQFPTDISAFQNQQQKSNYIFHINNSNYQFVIEKCTLSLELVVEVFITAVFTTPSGGTLSQLIEVNGRLTLWMALTLFRQVMQGLAHLEQQGILHEDIKGIRYLERRTHFPMVEHYNCKLKNQAQQLIQVCLFQRYIR